MEQKYDVFISYSRKDYIDENKNVIPGNEVSKIKEALTKAGISFWFDEDGVYSGDKFTEKIIDNIEASRIFLFLSTKNACESPWTSKEIACADEYGKYIIPVRVDKTPYNKKVMFRIADLSYVDYWKNPEKGRGEIVNSIRAFINELETTEKQKHADERRRLEDLLRQRRRQEEEKKRQEKIAKVETEIAAFELQRTERKKAVLLKEQELKLAQVDLEACENKIQKLQKKLQEFREPQMIESKRRLVERRAAEEKRKEDVLASAKTFDVDGVDFKMICVQGGSMGSFYIGETQVTQKLWKAVMGSNPSYHRGENNPVEWVSWNDICGNDGKGKAANCFLYKLRQKTGICFRLPNETEWDFAAKGGTKSKGYTYAGSNDIGEVALYEYSSAGKTHPVKSKKANELGLYDMSGNVWEWCENRYSSGGSGRVLRGGGCRSGAKLCRIDYRISHDPSRRDNDVGFRLVMDD